MDVDATREKIDGKTGDGSVRKGHATTGEDGVSRAPDDRLTFKAASGLLRSKFSVDWAGIAGLLDLLACPAKAWGKARCAKGSARVLWPASVIGRE